jgi:hypothetical protein
MDFSKAFDKVSHSLIIHKLKHYGITGKTNGWIKNFLSDMTQSVVVEDETSTSIPVESGVPQVSVLGPSLLPICFSCDPIMFQLMNDKAMTDLIKCFGKIHYETVCLFSLV